MERPSWKQVEKIFWLSDKYGFSKKLMFKLSFRYGVDKLENKLGLLNETPKIKNKTAYLIGMFKNETGTDTQN